MVIFAMLAGAFMGVGFLASAGLLSLSEMESLQTMILATLAAAVALTVGWLMEESFRKRVKKLEQQHEQERLRRKMTDRNIIARVREIEQKQKKYETENK